MAPPGLPRPSLSAVVRRTAHSLLVACVVPAALFYTAFELAGIWAAMGAALTWSYAAIAFRAVTARRTSGLLVLTALVLTARTALALAADSTFLYFLQPILIDVAVGVVFLASLATSRPMVARLAGDFYPMDDELSARPRVRMLFSGLTGLWAVVCLGKAAVMFSLLQSQPLDGFVRIQTLGTPTTNMTAAALTLALSVWVGHREGLLRQPA